MVKDNDSIMEEFLRSTREMSTQAEGKKRKVQAGGDQILEMTNKTPAIEDF